MRGGDKFWDFRSFNPPISTNNWANEYADSLDDDDSLLVRNTYKDVPVSWLGEVFVQEAEKLKRQNERAYRHEYLGIPVGVGGNVFENACDLDMSQLVTVYNGVGEEEKVPMYTTFDKIYTGLDWGYSVDPFRLVRMHFDAKHLDLYIFDEFSTLKTRNEDVFNILFNELKMVTKDDLIIADSAEEKSIADFKAYGAYIRGARKGPDSVRYGIKWLQGLNHIYIDKRRCPNTYREFIQYEYDTDKNGNFISAYPDKDNHCLVGETLVDTPNGQFKIEDLVDTEGKIYAYDIKNKKKVIADYIHCRVTFESAPVITIEFEDGRTLTCTDDHPILTHNRGYVLAGKLTCDDDIVTIDIV